MDIDDDGVVKEVKFLTFMLVAMNKVDRELIDRIREHFHNLDLTKSGTLAGGMQGAFIATASFYRYAIVVLIPFLRCRRNW
jgi:hypothetical protein